MPTNHAPGQGPLNNKSSTPEVPIDDAPDWRSFDAVLDELGLTAREFRRRFPHVSTDHVGFDGRMAIDQNQLHRAMR